MSNANKIAIVGIMIAFMSVVIALCAWLIPMNSEAKTQISSINNNNVTNISITDNTGVDPETHAKSFAENKQPENKLDNRDYL
jgi:hypothetical protein